MKVVLRKVGKTPLDFEVTVEKITFKGYLQYHSGKLVLLKAQLIGTLDKDCDICAENFILSVDEEVTFFISDGIYKDDASVELDVVESFDGEVDMEELLHSEIELIRSDYHSCANCSVSE